MAFGLNELQKCLAEWPSTVPEWVSASDPLIGRIGQILAKGIIEKVLDKVDLQPLIRHWLMREFVVSSDSVLKVPAVTGWPDIKEWESYGITAKSTDSGEFYLISAKPWTPQWLCSDNDKDIFRDIYLGKLVREDSRCAADPFIKAAAGIEQYSCPGQREAIRAAFLIPEGETLIVNLPTGSGKSLVGYAPALVHRQAGHLTIFIVPTVALAIDQAKQIEPYLFKNSRNKQHWPLVWYGGTDVADREEIRRRMRKGTQRILITSPEALTTSLLKEVFDVAEKNMLRYLVIDEAHLVAQWGDEFRPAFQMLAGLRNGLLRQQTRNQFRTMLLSATFTPETVDSLSTLFGPPKMVQMISAIHLRPEPQYWWHKVDTPAQKEEQVLEVLRHAPRPFILYVTTRKDAQDWFKLLKKVGYNRISRFDGDTADSDRLDIINKWRGDEIDGVVATSAFGVGIDKQDIRTIIHAAIPETLDRFYQEIGRGGRDGKPSISLLVYHEEDWSIVRTLASPQLISQELGKSRWEALYNNRIKDSSEIGFRVNLDSLRSGLLENSDENVKWNMRTLLLMSRAGVLNLEFEENDGVCREEVDGQERFNMVRIRLIISDHNSEDTWNSVVAAVREKTYAAGKRNKEMLDHILNNKKEISDVLSELYENKSVAPPVVVTKVCGGCPLDRNDNRNDITYPIPLANHIDRTSTWSTDGWRKFFPDIDPGYVKVFYEPDQDMGKVQNFIKKLVKCCEVKEICFPGDSQILEPGYMNDLYKAVTDDIVLIRGIDDSCCEPYIPLNRITVFEGKIERMDLTDFRKADGLLHVVLYPMQTMDPSAPHRRLFDVLEGSIRIGQLYNAILS
ncbi:protein DpdF [Chlorobium phaeovibrioides]|uniref:protein DpdF n=1 Tax=Chlorobium phaeovibrioides TaxID=1094 RepID=UPI0012315850|nr:protein DpdF [Chlorobium phaeovibrioides]QEQ57705.1 ATP-dependent DNA helicase RecQ [Chlorobium phaeovibrioides]